MELSHREYLNSWDSKYQSMEDQNPWWRGRDRFDEDEDYRRWREGEVRWIPSLLERIELRPFALHIISGPRQVGKTTLLKLLIKNLLEKVENPKAIFYFRCDKLADFKEMDEVIRSYIRIRRAENIKTSYLLLDEVTFPKDWYRAVKWHVDMGNFKNDVLVLTGSLSMFVKGEVETFPGRRGYGKDFVMLPLSFREFLNIVGKDLIGKIGKIEDLEINGILRECGKALPLIDKLNEYFEKYIECGGFPLAVKSLLEKGRIGGEVEDTYLSWIRGDIAKLKRSESIAKRVIKALIEKSSSTISYLSIAKEFEIKSHKTVFQYMDILEKLFLLKVLYFIEPNKGVEVFYKERKAYLTDPFLYRIFSSWCLTKIPEKSIIVESIVASHLARKFNIGYWRNRREIDVVAFGRGMVGFEVKYREKAPAEKIGVGKIRNVITLTKNEFNEDKLKIPVSIFLGSLNLS